MNAGLIALSHNLILWGYRFNINCQRALTNFTTHQNELCPPNLEGGGYIVFGVDPVSVRFHFSALSSEPVMDFDQTCIDTFLGGGEELIRFW